MKKLQCGLVSGHLRPSFRQSFLSLVDAEHPVGQLGYCLQVGIPRRRVEQDGGLPGGLLEGLAYVFHYLLGIFVKHGVVLHDQEAVVVLL